MPTSRISKLFQALAVGSATTVGAFFVWSKHCHFEPLDPSKDETFKNVFYRRFNATPNPTTHDVCVRKIPLFKLKPELVKDSANGGTKLVEAFCAGVWGGFGYTIQRLYLSSKYRNDTTTAHQLWTQQALISNDYPTGTEITDHFVVLSKTPTTILIRCGDSPLNSPSAPRPSDGLFEISAVANLDEGFAEFKLKSIFFQGLGKAEKEPMEGFMLWAHRQYTKLWMESAVRNCQP